MDKRRDSQTGRNKDDQSDSRSDGIETEEEMDEQTNRQINTGSICMDGQAVIPVGRKYRFQKVTR